MERSRTEPSRAAGNAGAGTECSRAQPSFPEEANLNDCDSPDFFRDVSNDLTLIVNLKAALRGIKLSAYATLIG
ncbi:hypothetical protein DUI87_33948 [Hirundo rustica rustica]|uniref:Uncharacterized protein n=1 Tax=Hirundo rustica rustica TaxID=333673 RepID=A0A3M0ILJ2_HIRRU|nr:hypothetical protein DUI87_33948 [Hirundo rustica rustica]